MKRQIRSATEPYGNTVNLQYGRMLQLKRSLQDAYDVLENMDDDTFNACDGEALIDDLDTAIHEVDDAMRFAKGEEI